MVHKQIPRWEGIRNERYIYAHYYDQNYEFFHDLQKDPLQEKNLINDPAYSSIIKELKAEREKKKNEYLNNPIRK